MRLLLLLASLVGFTAAEVRIIRNGDHFVLTRDGVPYCVKGTGSTKPFMVTQFGAPGHWESSKTSWGAPVEMTSTAKANWYAQGYLGSYVFIWGHKQEATATWYGMFLADGSRLGSGGPRAATDAGAHA